MKNTVKKIIALTCVLVMMIPFITVNVSAARIGDVVGYAQPTDIIATINGYQLESYNVDGSTYICVEDLAYYGFNVTYNNQDRSLEAYRNYHVSEIYPHIESPGFWSIGNNNSRKNILYTDISTYLGGNYTPSYNLGGRTIICFDDLDIFGEVSYNNDTREISLVIDDINYNPVAVLTALLNENMEYNAQWKTLFRAKGNVLVLIGTARSQLNQATINDYLINAFPQEKEDANTLKEIAIDAGCPVDSVYFEARNADGSIIATYQTP
ncbi:MAG: hypothetical protein IKL09_04415 [Clostridia bacterium]|nr:hypothetical protein [Clostridia bacterium]